MPRLYSLHTSVGKISYPLPPKPIEGGAFFVNSVSDGDLTLTFPSVNFQDIWKFVVFDAITGAVFGNFLWTFDQSQTVKILSSADAGTPPLSSQTVLRVITYNVLGESSSAVFVAAQAGSTGNPGAVAPYEIALFVGSIPFNGDTVLLHKFSQQVTFPAGFFGSKAKSIIAPTSNTTWTLLKSSLGTSAALQFGTINWLAGNALGSYAVAGEITFVPDDELYVVNQAISDPTMSGISLTMVSK